MCGNDNHYTNDFDIYIYNDLSRFDHFVWMDVSYTSSYICTCVSFTFICGCVFSFTFVPCRCSRESIIDSAADDLRHARRRRNYGGR